MANFSDSKKETPSIPVKFWFLIFDLKPDCAPNKIEFSATEDSAVAYMGMFLAGHRSTTIYKFCIVNEKVRGIRIDQQR